MLQIELGLRHRGVIKSCALPGWVATKAASGPGALSPDESARMLWQIISRLTIDDTAKFFEADVTTLTIVTPQRNAEPCGMTSPFAY